MASLEELLAEEGFKKTGKLKSGSRAPAASRAVSMPLYPDRDRDPLFPKVDSRLRKGRTRSDVYFRRSGPILSGKEGVIGGRSRSRLVRRGSPEDDGNGEETRETESIDLKDSTDVKELKVSSVRFQVRSSSSIQEEVEEYGGNEMKGDEGFRDRYPVKFERKHGSKKKYWNDLDDDERFRSRKERNFGVRPSFNDDLRGERHDDHKNSDSEPALDEAAINAVVSILTGYIRRFFKDEEFRASIRRGCDACLGINRASESDHKGSGAVTKLIEAIATVERVVQEVPDPIELRKASLKLSVITGLSSKDLKDEYTCGIPNSHLVACAHLYLSMIYKFQKKDKVSAKHLLQVFYESPYQARTMLLPRLWDHLFLPHLYHLRAWYDEIAESIPRSSSMTKKMKLLDNVYNNALDMGTYQFAVYYKEWLMEEAETPVLPSIDIPSASFLRIPREDSHSADSDGISSPRASVSSQSMVSKRLYESVFNGSKKMEATDEMRSREEEVVEDEEVEEVQLTRRSRNSVNLIQEDDDTGTYSPKPGINEQDDHSKCSPNFDASPDGYEWTASDSSRLGIPEAYEKLALSVKMKHSANYPVYDLYQSNRSNNTESVPKITELMFANSHINSFISNSSAEPIGNYEDIDQGSFFSSIPKDFLCPLTGHLFKDPVTLESGQTFERMAIKQWFDKGNRICPITGRALECLSVPITNFVLKHVIDGWKSEYFRNLLIFATQIAGNKTKHDSKSKDASALYIIEKLLIGFSIEEQMENATHLISLGGLSFLLRRLELGNLEEKTHVVSLMLCCIKADGSCRSYLAINIRSPCILELLHSEQVSARTSAVLLLIELICLNRRTAITSFVSGLQTEAIVNTMHVLLVYLKSTPPEERVLIAVLLLHLDIMIEPRRYCLYRDEAVNGIIVALDCCLSDKTVIPNTRRALLMLGGNFSSSGELLTETWLLKQAGFYDGSNVVSLNYEDEVDEMILGEEEAKIREEWLKSVTLVLLGDENGSFLETLSKCLASENPELVRVCLITLAWMSRALAFLSIAEIQLSAFSSLILRLIGSLEDGLQIEHRVLASLSLHNFSKISECRVLLMRNAEEMRDPLKSLVDVTWTAKHLYTVILGGRTGKK